MVRAEVAESTPRRAAPPAARIKAGAGLASLLLIAGAVSLALYRTRPPAPLTADAPAAEFSAERALAHVESVARAPHPVGSSEHAAVRERIVAALVSLGLNPEVQRATAVSGRRTRPTAAGTVHNVMARLKGSGGAKAVLLVAHYDSATNSPGAGDDASGVAAVLETLRALKAGPPPKNDVVALLTDGEESGLLGSQAFVDDHPWAADVGLVLNFDARGGGGTALMYETSPGNRRLVEEFARAASGPVVTNSLLYELYKYLPNDTDFTVFRKAGMSGLNFAFIGEPTRYHTPLDDLSGMDRRSLQHQGGYALSLARHFGGLDLAETHGAGDAVYFDMLGAAVVRYPVSWALPLAALAAVLFLVVVGAGVLRRRLRAGAVLLGALVSLFSVVAVGAVVWAAWWAARAAHGEYAAMPLGHTYNAGLYLAAFVALTVAVVSGLFVAARGRVGAQNLWAGAMLLWLFPALATSLLLPGASYLFLWPLLSSLAALAATLLMRGADDSSAARVLVLAAGALPGLVLLAPLIELIFTGLPMWAAGVPMMLGALLLVLLAPLLDYMTVGRRWLLPGAALLLFVAFVVAGSLTSSASASRPTPDSLLYTLDADSGRAFWASADDGLDAWTSRFFTKDPKEVLMKEFFPLMQRSFFVGSSEAVELAAPEATVVSDEQAEGRRLLRVRVASRRAAPVISIYLDPDIEVRAASVNGKPVEADAGQQWGLRYYAVPPEGLELSLAVDAGRPLGMRVIDQTYGLPAVGGEPNTQRPADKIPSLVPFSDTTQVGKSFRF